jgi:nucleoside-diphosphate-sugar epimerase
MAAPSSRLSRGWPLALDWVALRLVLVYGANVKGNMAELVRLARTPYPLPLGAFRSRRSLLSLDNLVAAVDAVLSAPGPAATAANRV